MGFMMKLEGGLCDPIKSMQFIKKLKHTLNKLNTRTPSFAGALIFCRYGRTANVRWPKCI